MRTQGISAADEQLLEPRGIFEAVFQGLGALTRIAQRFAFQPTALLVGVQELPQAFGPAAIGGVFTVMMGKVIRRSHQSYRRSLSAESGTWTSTPRWRAQRDIHLG